LRKGIKVFGITTTLPSHYAFHMRGQSRLLDLSLHRDILPAVGDGMVYSTYAGQHILVRTGITASYEGKKVASFLLVPHWA
jgi:hypothetical protein